MGTVCRSSVTVSLNYSTEDRRGQALWVETDGLIPLKEEGQRTGAGVAAVGGIKRRDENLLGRIGLAEALGQGLRLLECIILSVNDTYMDAQEVMHMTDYSKITALYSRLSVGDEDRDGGESNSIHSMVM